MPALRTSIPTIACGIALLAGLCGCSPEQPQVNTAPPAPPVDPRADAAALLAQVVGKIDQQDGVRNTVHGNLGMLGELTGEGKVGYSVRPANLTLQGKIRMSNDQSHPVKVSLVDGIGYVKSPLTRPQPGKPWLRVEPNADEAAGKLLGPALEQIQASIDPRSAFSGIEHSTKIQSSAPDHIEGKPTTRYELRVLTSRASETTTNPWQQARMHQAAVDGEPELAYRLWLDENGLPVRFTATRKVDNAGEVSLTSTYSDWGQSTNIQPPAPEEIGTLRATDLPRAEPPR